MMNLLDDENIVVALAGWNQSSSPTSSCRKPICRNMAAIRSGGRGQCKKVSNLAEMRRGEK
jgi:hypothetical protein